MILETMAVLKEFDNAHDFERMCADLLRAQGCKEVILVAPRGGKDGGQDIIFTTEDGSKGLACVTLRQDIDKKFNEDFLQRKPGEYTKYVLFCTAYLTYEQKLKFAKHCANTLEALFTPYDIESLRGLLDVHQDIRERYLHIPDQSRLRQQETLAIVSNQIKANELFNEAKQAMANYDWVSAEALMQTALQYFPLPEAPSYYGVQMSKALIEKLKRKHDIPPGYRQNALLHDIHIHLQFFAPPIERAIEWLERARKQNEEGEETAAVVVRSLAFLRGISRNYDEMLVCVKEAISISPDFSRKAFKEPEMLAILAHGCVDEIDQAIALQKLGEELKLRLPVSPQVVQHSITDSDYSICWIVMGKEDAWIGKPKPPDFPMQLWIKTGYDGGTTGRIATYPNPHEPGKNTLIPPDGNGIPLDQLINQLADQFLFICHLPANPQFAP